MYKLEEGDSKICHKNYTFSIKKTHHITIVGQIVTNVAI